MKEKTKEILFYVYLILSVLAILFLLFSTFYFYKQYRYYEKQSKYSYDQFKQFEEAYTKCSNEFNKILGIKKIDLNICEGKIHPMCVGYWEIINDECYWNCQANS